MVCERIEKNKVMLRLRNHHTDHENRGTGSGTLKHFRSDSGACVDVRKSNSSMSMYDIGMYRDTLGYFQVGSVLEGRFGTRKCTLMGAWAGTQRGLNRGFYSVCAGMNARENYAGMSSGRITREENIGRR